jgi:hypothetical protein
MPRERGQDGSILVYLILGLVAFGVLAVAGGSRFGASVVSVLSPNCNISARHMSEAGMRYAMARLRAAGDQTTLDAAIAQMNGTSYTVNASKGLAFTLGIGYDGSGNLLVTSTGQGCAGLIHVDSPALSASVNVPNVGSQPASTSEVIDFSNLADDFFNTADLQGTGPIQVDASTKTITFGNLNEGNNAAAIWYAGNATIGCLDGACAMEHGLRAYFTVQWNSSSVADGLVFGIISALTNGLSSVGGDVDMGELMGWAGGGTSGSGILPPKIGLEFDTYYNSCNTPLYAAGSRCDPSYTSLDHLAYVFWGSNDSVGGWIYSNYYRRNIYKSGNFYDDNRHGAGSGSTTEPVSSNDPDDSGSGLYGIYYKSPANWLRNGTKYYIRYELTRLTTASAGSAYCYMLKTWITNSSPSDAYKDVTADYDANAYPPTLQQVIFLNSTYHANMYKVFFGWTEATGDSTQKITVGDFKLTFKKQQPTYGTAPSGYTAYWPMHNNIGTSVTEVANGRTGTILGAARWVPGIATPNGAALAFNGSTYMYASDNTALDLTDAGTVSLWFKMTGTNSGDWLLHKGTTVNSSEAYGLQINSGGKILFRLRRNGSTTAEVISTTTPVQNRWYHVAATWTSPGTLRLYVNGVSEATVSAVTARDSTDYFYLGSGTSGTSTAFTGIIDEVYLYKQELTAAQVAQLATGAP